MSEINFQKININLQELAQRNANTINICTPSFLKITANSTSSAAPAMGIVRKSSDVISGSVQNEIDTLNQEVGMINSVVAANTNTSTDFSAGGVGRKLNHRAKIIGHTAYVSPTPPEYAIRSENGHVLKETTDVSRLLGCLELSPYYDTETQRTLLTGAVTKLAEWLDDMIVNYDTRVAEGSARGDSEVKLSFLLRLRHKIENCEFPVGFGNDIEFAEAAQDDPGSIILGCYSNSFYPEQYLNPTDNTHCNNAVTDHYDRSILLNAAAFIPTRMFSNEMELRAAINSGNTNFNIGDILMASTEFYNNYAQVYLASVLAHEFIHATHIANEAITYNTCEMIEDDFRNEVVFNGWSQETQDAIDTIFEGLSLNNITYGEGFIPLGQNTDSGLGFHDLGDLYDVAQHGFEENTAYSDWWYEWGYNADAGEWDWIGIPYTDFSTGNNLNWDVLPELRNFSIYT